MRVIPARTEMRTLLELAIPIITVQVGLMFMGVVDTVMVGHLSSTALAAVALGNLFFFALTIFAMGTLLALDPLIAQAVGANDPRAITRAVQRGLILCLALSVSTSCLLPFSGPVLRLLKQPAAVVPVSSLFINTIIPSVLPMLGFVVLRQTLQAMGRIAPIVLTIVAGNVLNLVLNWVLIYGKIGAPALGVAGSAWATTISRWVMFFALLLIGWPLLKEHLKPVREALALRPLLRTLTLGLPIGISHFIEYANFAGIALLMGLLGTNEIAAHQVAINIASLTFMVPAGIGAAAAVLVGNAVGRGNTEAARQAAQAALFAGGAVMCVSAFFMLAIPNVLAGVYTNDAAVLAIAVTLLPIAGLFQVFDGLQVVGAGILRGAGDTRVPMLIGIAGFWLVGMPISVYFGLYTPARAAGLWWGFVAGLAAVAIFLLLRIRSRFTSELRRIVIDDHVFEIE